MTRLPRVNQAIGLLSKLMLLICISLTVTSCDKDYYYTVVEPNAESSTTIKGFSFLAKNNPDILLSDVSGEIFGDSLISVRIPYLTDSKTLVPTIQLSSNNLFLSVDNDKSLQIDSNKYTGEAKDFTKQVIYSLSDKVNDKPIAIYKVNVVGYTGLPIMSINTENDAPITSKEDYVKATISVTSQQGNDTDSNLDTTAVKIKGRGNSTWGLPKKPYKLKFDDKVSLFGEAKNKEWVLLANYTDKTLLRNATALHMGEISNLSWTPCSHFVELYLNHHYMGTYQLTEQIKIGKDRVNVTDDGYLLEVDAKPDVDDVTFTTTRSGQPYNIKDPDIEKGSERYNWIQQHIQHIEDNLYSDNYLSDDSYYKKYVDIESFADWYLINEITKNNDACMFSSCYMNVDAKGTLRMGPIWDFDISLGNINYNGNMTPEGFWIKNSYFISRMFDDPSFTSLVRTRFDYFKSHINEIYNWINQRSEYLKYSAVENNNVWETLYKDTWPNYAVVGTYQNEVVYMKSFLKKRMEWLDENLPK